MRHRSTVLAVALVLAVPGRAPGLGDQIYFPASATLATGSLPQGPVTVASALAKRVEAAAVAPDGSLLAIDQRQPFAPTPETHLVEIDAGGGLLSRGIIDLLASETPLDLAFDLQGGLYLLTRSIDPDDPFVEVSRLLELDPDTGAVASVSELAEDVVALAPAPVGLWAIGNPSVYRLAPESGVLSDAGFELEPGLGPAAADTDSTGVLWILNFSPVTSPPVAFLWRFDPATGARPVVALAPPQDATALAIDRRCEETATARCLQGGRFRVEVSWQDFAGVAGEGRTAPSRSADSALFWFFDAANWELLVKVLNGCDDNKHFWVFSAATTDVAYTLRVTDLETEETRVYENSLGEAAAAVTDTAAFAGCPVSCC